MRMGTWFHKECTTQTNKGLVKHNEKQVIRKNQIILCL